MPFSNSVYYDINNMSNMAGTPLYCAPEFKEFFQYFKRSEEEFKIKLKLHPESDWYSFGLIILLALGATKA